MIKVLLIMLFIGPWLPCFPIESPQTIKKIGLHDESLVLVYIGSGNDSLLAHNYLAALEGFKKATALLGNRQNCNEVWDFVKEVAETLEDD